MPEGDEVWRTAHRLHEALAGRVLLQTDFRWPSLATLDLSGRTTLEVVAAGKHLLHRLERGATIHSHLKMDGSWHLHRSDRTWNQRPRDLVRVVLVTSEWTAVGHHLGILEVVPTCDEHTVVGHLGPDVLGPDWDPVEAARRLAADPDRPLGEALLDQRVLAGVGTFYLCEGCFLLGVSPWTPVGAGPDPRRVVELLHALLAANRDRVGQSTTGDTRPGRQAYVHARAGRPCRRCGTAVRVAEIGTQPRTRPVFYCPRCQRVRRPTPDGR